MVTILISIILCFTISTISLLPLERFSHFPLHVISLLLFFCRRYIGLMLPAGKNKYNSEGGERSVHWTKRESNKNLLYCFANDRNYFANGKINNFYFLIVVVVIIFSLSRLIAVDCLLNKRSEKFSINFFIIKNFIFQKFKENS